MVFIVGCLLSWNAFNFLAINMPRKSKCRRFRGIAKQFIPTSQRAVSSDSPVVQDETESSSSNVVTTSARKREQSALSGEEYGEEMWDATELNTGHRLIDLQYISEAMSRLHMCEDGKLLGNSFESRMLATNCLTFFLLGSIAIIDERKYSGLSCQLAFQCTKCGRKTVTSTSKRCKRSQEV